MFKDPEAVTRTLQDIYDVKDSLTEAIIHTAKRYTRGEIFA
jgi:hypothetical protein